MSVPRAISSLSGLNLRRFSEMKLAGRMLAYSPSSFLRRRIPCSGRMAAKPHFGPPTAPARQQSHHSRQTSEASSPDADELGLGLRPLTEENTVRLPARLERRLGERVAGEVDGSTTKGLVGDLELEVGALGEALEHTDSLARHLGS